MPQLKFLSGRIPEVKKDSWSWNWRDVNDIRSEK